LENQRIYVGKAAKKAAKYHSETLRDTTVPLIKKQAL
jgi:hypothetical protein